MAKRPVFVPKFDGVTLVDIIEVEFEWFPGMHFTQKQKSIRSLHEAYLTQNPEAKILEISSKSEIELGTKLSAFNLMFKTKSGKSISVESIFQASKVFSNGGPYKEIMDMTSRDAKKDERLKNSGNLIAFEYRDSRWELEPKTAFYDWLYLNALNLNDNLKEQALAYNAFTDIEFNPQKSINCQAYSIALFVALTKCDLLVGGVIPPKDEFIQLVEQFKIKNTSDGLLF
ncbi:DarT1-associated NADAR antitoxin family protein [Acinetobacter sp. Marseille-Q1623]|uniref:DarT1-associated NADAR antitoxin family protein n=1 Tax=Acinetobacter sp. Marseille-Q1623 TaxID=2697501 RepID=UPI00157B6FB0|nr:hypothetical protein [Acinetobacter sp. Marseille-Q1623]